MLLAYSYCSDKLVEKAVGISSVAEIFQLHSEAFFRDNEVYICFSNDVYFKFSLLKVEGVGKDSQVCKACSSFSVGRSNWKFPPKFNAVIR
jgi:hypothetical protein